MSTTYYDAFIGSGAITSHDGGGGLGTWLSGDWGETVPTLADNAVKFSSDGADNGAITGTTLAVTATGFEVYWEQKGSTDTSAFWIPFFASVTDRYSALFTVYLRWWEESPGVDGWSLYLNGTTTNYATATFPVASAFRFGVVFGADGTAKTYSEPAGGGARTYRAAGTWTPGAYSLQFLLAGSAFVETGRVDNFTVIVNAAATDPAKSTVALGAWSGAGGAYIGHTATATLTAKDSSGNPITSGGETVVFGGTKVTAGATTDVGDGTYTATITAATAGAGAVSATIGGVTVSTTMPTATVLTVPTATSTAALSPSTNFYAGRTATVTLTTPDGVGGLTVVFGTTGGTSVITFGAVTDVGNGTYTATATAVTAGTATTLTATLDGAAASAGMPNLTVPTLPTPAARGARGGALVYSDAASVAKWAAARQYALRFALGGAGRWQRFAVVHGATVSVSTSDVNYFALYALRVKGQPVKQRTDTF